jgi:(2Fe-2S) ferredoxin
MELPKYHLFLCNSFRAGGEAKGVCVKKDATDLMQYIEGEITDRGLDAMLTSCGCLKQCDRGPVLMVYPQGWWYGTIDKARIDEILDAMEEDAPVEDYLLT